MRLVTLSMSALRRRACRCHVWGGEILRAHEPPHILVLCAVAGVVTVPSACGHVCTSYHDTCVGGGMTGPAFGRGVERGWWLIPRDGARNACEGVGKRHMTIPNPHNTLGTPSRTTHRGASSLRHPTHRVLRELAPCLCMQAARRRDARSAAQPPTAAALRAPPW